MTSRLVRIICGAALLLAAASLSSGAMERALLGQASGGLAWGPALFRILLAFHGAILIAAALRRPSAATLAVPTKPVTRTVWILLGSLSVAALALRLWHLDSCLWLDEVLTMVDYAKAPFGSVITSFPNQNQHMLFSLMANVSLRIFGEHAWALRLPSVLFGVASLWALFLLARRLVPLREALFACALMAFSYHHIWFSQNARGYMGLLFFTLLATWLWLEALERNSSSLWTAYAVACALGAWIHITMVFLVAAHGIAYLGFRLRPSSLETRAESLETRAGWRPLAAWILFGTLTLQFHALALPDFFRSALHEVSVPSEWTSPLWVIAETIRSLHFGFLSIAVLACGGLIATAGWAGILRREPRAALIMVLPGILGGGTMLAMSHNLWPRFFFFLMGFALLIAVHGVALVTARLLSERMAAPVMAIAAALTISASAATLPRGYALPKQDFTGARDFAERISAGNIAVAGLAEHVYGRYYAPHWKVVQSAAEVSQLLQERDNVLLVYTLPIELSAFHPELWRSIQENFEEQKVFPGTLGGGEVYVCRVKSVHRAFREPPDNRHFEKVRMQ